MNKPLRILILEDSAPDAELNIRELRNAGYDPQWQRVETEADYLAALDPAPDLILADYSLPGFDGLSALKLLRERHLDIPFILVSGMLGEEAAVEAMKLGATDFLLKDNIARLGGAVERTLEEKRLRTENRESEAALRASEERLRLAMNAAQMGSWDWDMRTGEILWSPHHERIFGYQPDTPRRSYDDFKNRLHPEDVQRVEAILNEAIATCGLYQCEFRVIWPDGSIHWVSGFGSFHLDAGGVPTRMVGMVMDITERKEIEDQIRQLNEALELRVVERTLDLRAAVTSLESEIERRQRLEREILEISEREQSRLGQDLHDGLGQELAGIALIGNVLATQLDAESHPLAETASNIATYILQTIDSARRLAKGFYPIELNRYGLWLALEDLATQTSQRVGIHCELRQNGEFPTLDESARIHVYRIVQESIGNAIKHGKAKRIIIEFIAGEGCHTFTVTDDGVGFEKPVASPGMGLHLMDYRARVIGAEIGIERTAQGGCRVTCRLPA